MPLPADRALRRLVAELAAATPEDIEAILQTLEASQQARVEELLAEYIGASPEATEADSPPPPPPSHLRGLSPWLGARLDGVTLPMAAVFPGDIMSYDMTAHARDALNGAAASVRNRNADRDEPAPAETSSFMGRLSGAVLGRPGV